jgi:putative ABC transport system permease protein
VFWVSCRRSGALFDEGEDRQGGPRAVLLSHGAWRSRWGGDAAIVGRSVEVNSEPVMVVGVLPADLDVPLGIDAPELWLAKPYDARILESRDFWITQVVARLRSGSTVADAQRELDNLSAAAREQFPDLHGTTQFVATPLRTFWVGEVRGALLFLFACGVLVLLVACVNLGILVAARNSARGGELAVRRALGAAHTRLARSILAESMVLGVLGTVLGLLLSLLLENGVRALSPLELPRISGRWLDVHLVLFSSAVAITTGLVIAVAPIVRALRTAPAAVLRTRGSAESGRLSRFLVGAECAAVLTLLLAATLAGRGFLAVLATDPGFSAADRLVATVTLPTDMTWRADGGTERNFAFLEQARQRFIAMPGVESAGFVTNVPLTPASMGGVLYKRGEPLREAPTVDWEMAGAGYFEAAGIEVLQGRTFTSADMRAAPLVAIVNETLARRYFPRGDAIGSVITGESADGPWRTIIGIVADVKQQALGQPETRPQMYIHDQQGFATDVRKLVIRSRGDPLAQVDAVRAAIREVNPAVVVDEFRPMSSLIEESAADARFHALLLIIFAATSTVLGLAGVFGVVSDAVNRRRSEIALRMALGASRRTVLAAELLRGLQPVALGMVGGMLLTVIGVRVAGGLVAGLDTVDPATALSVAAGLLVVSVIAVIGPARRAASVPPADVLQGT